MTPETRTTASLPQASFLPLLAVLALSIVAIVLALAFSANVLGSAGQAISAYDNSASRKMLARAAPGSLTITTPELQTTVKKEVTMSWKSTGVENLRPSAVSSPIQYFYEQTGTAHPWSAYDSRAQIKGAAFSEQALGGWLGDIAKQTNQNAQDAALVIENERAVTFTPHQDGYTLDLPQALLGLKHTLLSPAAEYALPLKTSLPQVRLADLNNLGINERLARGQSDFTGSTAARINNIRVGASKYNGIIVRLGEEFSFNQYLGPVDAAHGFVPELVIKPEGATPEFGGGLCQVSTTAFRAAFFGGLPITQRRNHSYAVHYYEWIADDQPLAVGLDATIYAPYQDMKFVNDTPGAILIWTRVEGKRLYFDFYGTEDGRQVAVDGPHPFDRRLSGAVKSTVTRKVLKDGETREVTFNSAYIPPKIAEQSYQLPAAPPAAN